MAGSSLFKRPVSGAGPAADLAREMRMHVKNYIDNHPDISTLTQYARQVAHISTGLLSSTLNGRSVPTTDAVRSVLAPIAGPHDASGLLREFEQKRAAAAGSAIPNTDMLLAAFDAHWRAWDQFEAADPEYRDFNRLLSEDDLASLFGLARNGSLNDVPGGAWAFLVCSAVQHGYHYRRLFELGVQQEQLAILEALIEVMTTRDHLRPRWRAAWLLQRVTDARVKAAVLQLTRELPPSQHLALETQQELLDAIEWGTVEDLLDTIEDPRMTADQRGQLRVEFRSQFLANSARGLLAGYLAEQIAPPSATTDALMRERLGSARPLYFVANRIRLTLIGQHPHDREETLAGLSEGLSNSVGDVIRAFGSQSTAARTAATLAEHLTAWMASSTVTGSADCQAQAKTADPAETTSQDSRAVQLLEELNRNTSEHDRNYGA